MMSLIPSSDIKASALNTRLFIKEHTDECKKIAIVLFPYLAAFVIILIGANYILYLDVIEFSTGKDAPKSLSEIAIFMNELQKYTKTNPAAWVSSTMHIAIIYCFAILAINWYQFIILGSDQYERISPIAPQKHDLKFIGMLLFLFIILPEILNLSIGRGILSTFISLMLLPYAIFKISFYFSAKAFNPNISLMDSFHMTHGYFWKFILTFIRASYLIFIIYFALIFIWGFIGGAIAQYIFDTGNISSVITRTAYEQLIISPVYILLNIFIFTPLFIIFGVTTLSNYYLFVLQNNDKAKNMET